jgi:proton-translocating NADH-quinone oxidoreductase chain N
MNFNFSILFENDCLALFPELYLITSTLFLLMYGVIVSTSEKYNYPLLMQNIGGLGLWSLGGTFLLILWNPLHESILFYNTLILDEMTFFFKMLLISSAFCAILLSFDLSHQKEQSQLKYLGETSEVLSGKTSSLQAFEYMILLLLSTGSMLFMISSYDFLSFYLTLELQSLCFYVLAASKRNSEFSTEAGLKYFLLGAFSSGIFLFGCSMIYGFTGLTNFGDLAKIFTGSQEGFTSLSGQSTGVIIGIVFLAVGFLFKLTAAPFHMWAPDVYEGSPTPFTAFFSIVPKIALFAVFLRLFFWSFYDFMLPWQKILLFCSLASMSVGALAALGQHKIKRLLAYSSVGHVGYLLIGICCATSEGFEAFLIYLLIYVFMTINLFAIILSCQESHHDFEKEKTGTYHLKYISDLGMLGQMNPVLAFTLTCTLFSMAGIPPLAGFCSKFYLFFAALSSSLYFLAFFGVLTSVVSCFYYIRMIKIMYFEKPTQFIAYQSMDREKSILLGITLFFMIFFFFYPSPLFFLAHQVALSCSF